ncbi:cytotoxic and regulatory T-cell molecule isoform X2 [Enoplosus armatus]|uniref:cytotoxic and regulatory T-cell molecule isoform X2 n=1 Tax=Enoplosus armatus TaxID=215367 RepID=UPI00399149A1
MEVKLQLGVLVALIHVSLAVWQRVTVMQGQTVNLRCPVTNGLKTDVDWKNPGGHVMFFNHNTGVKNKRYSIVKLTESEFTASISDVTFKDGGNYTCIQYDRRTTERKVEVTVLGRPEMSVEKNGGEFVIKCSAAGNHYPPQIFWKLDHGPELLPYAQVLREGQTYVSTDVLHVSSVESRVAVKCLVRHPALRSRPLMNFVKVGRDSTKHRRTTTTSAPTPQPGGSPTTWRPRRGRTAAHLATTGANGPSPEGSPRSSAAPPNRLLSSATGGAPTGSHRGASGSTRRGNDTTSNATSTTGRTSETTEDITFSNHTEGNGTGSFNDPKMRTGTQGSSLLVFLVTCLIFCLLVVVIFFAIKLRRAHITWKRDNEDSDPSEDSGKSKSSQEEKNSSQGQRRRGLVNTAFTQYVAERPAATNTAAAAATGSGDGGQAPQPQTSARCDIKETEL